MLFDDILRHIGEFGRYQIYLYILLGLVGIPTAWQNMAITFFGADMDHWCHVTELANNFTAIEQKMIAVPPDEHSRRGFSRCYRYEVDFTRYTYDELNHWNRSLMMAVATPVIKCDHWVFDRSVFSSSIVSQMGLVCERAYLVSVVQTIYMAGFLTGCIGVGQISDRFGRYVALISSISCEVAFAFAAALTPNFVGYVILRFFVGAGAAGGFTTIFVMCMEIIGPKYRMTTGVMVQGWFSLGLMSMPLFAYFIRDHVTLQLVCAGCTALLFPYFYLIPESPRWLAARGEDKKATKILQVFARHNRRPLPDKLQLEDNRHNVTKATSKPTFVALLRTPNLRKISINMWLAWFITCLVYYGLSLGVSLLDGGNIFINSFLSGAVEIPSYVVTLLVLDRFGRRWPAIFTFLAAGLCCFICLVLLIFEDMEGPITAFLMIGKFFIAATFAIVYVYAAELFPTVVRQVGVGSSSMCARVGSLIQPQIANLATIWTPGPFIFYSITSILAGVSIFFLPETLHTKLPDTIEDGEKFGRRKSNTPDVTIAFEKRSSGKMQATIDPA